MTAYYNEIDKYCAEWLRNLILEGLIPAGVVDDRSICEVQAADLVGFTQCHFFAGLGGWGYALRLAGWPDNRPVWTGSCPCQPFSVAGKQKGFADERHLWPVWFNLIRQCRPAVVFGEQVASAQLWLDGVCSDMEAEGYAIGAAVLPACAVDAPHKRDRLWFVAHAGGAERWSLASGGMMSMTGQTPDGKKRQVDLNFAVRGCGSLPEHLPGGDSLNEKPRAADCTSSRTK
jgi:DNA (cytosine-5)-methyltransferase 1